MIACKMIAFSKGISECNYKPGRIVGPWEKNRNYIITSTRADQCTHGVGFNIHFRLNHNFSGFTQGKTNRESDYLIYMNQEEHHDCITHWLWLNGFKMVQSTCWENITMDVFKVDTSLFAINKFLSQWKGGQFKGGTRVWMLGNQMWHFSKQTC